MMGGPEEFQVVVKGCECDPRGVEVYLSPEDAARHWNAWVKSKPPLSKPEDCICGCSPTVAVAFGLWWVECHMSDTCSASTPQFHDRTRAVWTWNAMQQFAKGLK